MNIIINDVTFELVEIPAGEFDMGSNDDGFHDENPIHRVKIEKPFYMGKFPVTQRQWDAVGDNPSYFTGENLPVEQVSWHDCIAFCEKLSRLTGREYRLPSEAEWEYACRAGTQSQYWWGDEMDDNRCWHYGNSGKKTHPVDEKVNEHTNPFGLCDMSGNVWEWTHSDYEAYGSGSELVLSKNTNKDKSVRGGSWVYDYVSTRSANRNFHSPTLESSDVGFRVVLISL